MDWNKEDSRAVKPPSNLLNSDVPVLGTGTHAVASPLPYGLGVYSVHSDGSKRPLPLYYVSEKVAASRGRGVKEGWYVAAVPGTGFELRVTAVQQRFPSVNGRHLAKGHGIGAEVFVDGRLTNGSYYLFDSGVGCGAQATVTGFVESAVFEEGTKYGKEVVRKFSFRKAKTVEEETPGTDSGTGCIRVVMFSGMRHQKLMQMSSWKRNTSKKEMQVKEKEATKDGKSIEVDRSGVEETVSSSRSVTYISRSLVVGSFTVFFREQFWMQSRNLVDSEGNAWTPKKDSAVIELETDDTENETADAKLGKRASSSSGSRKKVKREVVDLTIIRDSIDLTKE